MNERIKELMLQAFQEHYGDPVTPGAREKALELVSGWGDKFAELIVKECSEICLQQSRFSWNDDRKIQARLDSNLIKEHFGVK